MDKIITGRRTSRIDYDSAAVHFRMPSIAPGVTAFLWGLGLGLFIWFGLRAVGFPSGRAFMLGALSACAIFLFVRRFGGDHPGA